MARSQDVIFQRPKDVCRGRPLDVGRGRALALHRGPYGDLHRMSFRDVLRKSSGRNFAGWVNVHKSYENKAFCLKYLFKQCTLPIINAMASRKMVNLGHRVHDLVFSPTVFCESQMRETS